MTKIPITISNLFCFFFKAAYRGQRHYLTSSSNRFITRKTLQLKVIFVSLSPPWTLLSGVQKEAFYWPVAFPYQCEGPASPKQLSFVMSHSGFV